MVEARIPQAQLVAKYPATTGDSSILDAFAARCRHFADNYLHDPSPEEEDEYWTFADAKEAIVVLTPATTIAGVIAKLRMDFVHRVGTSWSDLAMMDPSHPDFIEGLSEAGPFAQRAWLAIEDLARMGGVDLAAMVRR